LGERELTRADLADLAAEYAAELPGLLEELAGLLEASAADPAAVPRACAAAHRLRGTAGSYGFTAVGQAAGAVEDALEEGAAAAPAQVRALAALVRQSSTRSSGSSK
jgi:HPt (histidine-containing phosphotransfer) domain-containing protein